MSPAETQAAWSTWVARRNAEIRARVRRGDEDSLVNLWWFGTSFTSLPPARPVDVAAHDAGATLSTVVNGRLDDLLEGLIAPGANSRLRFARQLVTEQGVDPTTSAGRSRARAWLITLAERVREESAQFARAIEAGQAAPSAVGAMVATLASVYRDRGLSSDTSLLSSFGIDAALGALEREGRLGDRPIRRVAIVGPGLDVINKADGYDFYPEQTIQPFALVDTLVRGGMSELRDLSVTTFDLSPRVNQHLDEARSQARAGVGYVMHLPLSDAERWTPSLVKFWETAGARIGNAVAAIRVPPAAGRVRVRAVRVRPEVVARIEARDLNVVLERLEPAGDDGLFDLVIATNVLTYYGTFEQALAVTNIARMLRPGGSLLSNQAVLPVPPMKPDVGDHRVVYSDRQIDHVFWYQRE
jgi:SAM-dependent methyltransferase